MARRRILISLIIVGGGPPGWLAAQQDSLPPGVTAATIEKGKELYGGAGLCFACHGPEGKGAIGPDLTDSVWVHHDGSFEAIVQQLIRGVPEEESKSGTPMPPRGGSGLSDDELKAVAAYVWTLSRKRSEK